MGCKLLSCLFIGYAKKAGGEWNNGDVLVIDWDQLQNADRASEVYIKRLNHKEVFPVKFGDNTVSHYEKESCVSLMQHFVVPPGIIH